MRLGRRQQISEETHKSSGQAAGMQVCVCITPTIPEISEYHRQLRVAATLTQRLHVDVMDGTMTTTISPALSELSWPPHFVVDVHIMSKHPTRGLAAMVQRLQPRLVIVHAEADGDFHEIADIIHRHGAAVGVAIMPQTPVEILAPAMESIDHVMLFSGHIGHFGGEADLRLLERVPVLLAMKNSLEIGWDGGVNDVTIVRLLEAGVRVANVGGYIQKASHPQKAYATLMAALSQRGTH